MIKMADINLETQTVLIVDPDKSIQASLESVLKTLGDYRLRVMAVSSGAEARDLIRESNAYFDLVLLGYAGLPGNGRETLRTIKEASPDSAVIAMTGSETHRIQIEALEQGADYFLPKPWDDLQLTSLVRIMLDKQLAGIDSLTKLYTRRQLFKELERHVRTAIRHNIPSSLSVLMVDIDNFHDYNNTYGHPQGDQALRDVADTLKKSFRAEDALGRYGGEEFIVLLPHTSLADSLKAAERLRSNIKKLQIKPNSPTNPDAQYHNSMDFEKVTVSIGSAGFPETDICSLITYADQALYTAKQAGKDQVKPYSYHG